MAYGSTIKQKMGICPMCSDGKEKPLIKGMCNWHYWQANKMKSLAKQQEREVAKDESLSVLIMDLDRVYSRYMRLSAADLYKNIECYTCGKKDSWVNADLSHFIPRGCMYLRFDPRNTRVCCQHCNRNLNGNLVVFAQKLEEENPGIVEILQEESRLVHHFSRHELKAMIADYTRRLQRLAI